jgi:hypothetical protein
MSNTLNEIEAGVNIAGAAGAVLGGPIGAEVDAALPVAESIVNTVVAQSPHQTALTDIANAVTAAAPVIASAGAARSPATATQVTAGVSALQAVIAFLKSVL